MCCFLHLCVRQPARLGRFRELFMTCLSGKSALLFLPPLSQPLNFLSFFLKCVDAISPLILLSHFSYRFHSSVCLMIRLEISLLLLVSSLLARTVALPPLGSEEGWVWCSYVLTHVLCLASVCTGRGHCLWQFFFQLVVLNYWFSSS